MEKQLLERAANGTMDDVDFEMIKARLHNTIDELHEHLNAINTICNEHDDELKIMGLNLIVVADSMFKVSPLKVMVVYGSRSFMQKKMIPEIITHLEK